MSKLSFNTNRWMRRRRAGGPGVGPHSTHSIALGGLRLREGTQGRGLSITLSCGYCIPTTATPQGVVSVL
eukprot:scaffold22819_cov28-Tisochrysis_lutea.AAC.6